MDNYIQPDMGRTRNGRVRWSYGFADLEVGDVLKCPIMDGETKKYASVRVHSAAICWSKKKPERNHIRFSSRIDYGYILLTRTQ